MRIGLIVGSILSVAVTVMPAVLPIAEAAGPVKWLTYQNDRYGTTIDYPDFFKMGRPPDNDDGRKFSAPDGGEFSVFASFNVLDYDLAGYQASTLKSLDPGSVVTYQTHGDNWFVISGTRGDAVFYERHLLSHRGELTNGLVISYPAKLKQIYDPIVTRMSQSFRAGTGFQTSGKP
jgi:hypothetical protein